ASGWTRDGRTTGYHGVIVADDIAEHKRDTAGVSNSAAQPAALDSTQRTTNGVEFINLGPSVHEKLGSDLHIHERDVFDWVFHQRRPATGNKGENQVVG